MMRRYFYPRSPCGERQVKNARACLNILISIHALLAESDFLPYLPMAAFCHFYPRSPCGERPEIARTSNADTIFLSTLSLRRATCVKRFQAADMSYFYPRSPCGERLTENHCKFIRINISIHALLAESDTPSVLRHCTTYLFLSTLSLRRATNRIDCYLQPTSISIHALLAESDVKNTLRQIVDRRISIHALLAESD